jgi:uncharacterized protein YggE
MRSVRRALFVAALVLAAAALAGVAQPRLAHSTSTEPAAARTITVTGDGTATTVPDRASFQFGVDARGETAKEALARTSDEATAVIAALEAEGVATADLQTTGVSLSPQSSRDGTTIIGYSASNSVSATASLAKAGDLVDAAVNAGADSVSGPGLDTSERAALYRDALKQALANAKAKAEVLAAAAGVQLGAVQTVAEQSGAQPLPYADRAAYGAALQVEPGTQAIDATVTVTYALNSP